MGLGARCEGGAGVQAAALPLPDGARSGRCAEGLAAIARAAALLSIVRSRACFSPPLLAAKGGPGAEQPREGRQPGTRWCGPTTAVPGVIWGAFARVAPPAWPFRPLIPRVWMFSTARADQKLPALRLACWRTLKTPPPPRLPSPRFRCFGCSRSSRRRSRVSRSWGAWRATSSRTAPVSGCCPTTGGPRLRRADSARAMPHRACSAWGVHGPRPPPAAGTILRQSKSFSNEVAAAYASEVLALTKRARHMVRDLDPRVRARARGGRRLLRAPAVSLSAPRRHGRAGSEASGPSAFRGEASAADACPCTVPRPLPSRLRTTSSSSGCGSRTAARSLLRRATTAS